MKKLLLLLCIAFAFMANGLSAQTAKGKDSIPTASGSERVQALKVAFITKRLSLTAAEAEKFWPIYNEYQDKREVARKQLQSDYQLIRDQGDKLSEEELTRLDDEIISLKVKDAALVAEMNEKLKKVLPAKKLAELYVAEEDFKKVIIDMLTNDNKDSKPK
jgi:hypothetical protein